MNENKTNEIMKIVSNFITSTRRFHPNPKWCKCMKKKYQQEGGLDDEENKIH